MQIFECLLERNQSFTNFEKIFLKSDFLRFQVAILDYTSIICPGKQFVLHLQAIIEEVTLKNIICKVDKKTGEKTGKIRFIKQDDLAIVRFASEDVICMETFKDHPQLGRFTLRDEGKYSIKNRQISLVLFLESAIFNFQKGPKSSLDK